ncbi:hypothetical protein [uncultured Chryseobacterium sp.]|uniref:hypothetical protein n=1 Tax=uncultured Chryseobacterium sp. TaxID=259322 RepID=UPI003748BF0E
MKEKDYKYLLGKNRSEIKEELGDGFNFYHSDIWTYNIKKDWLGRWYFLYLHFRDGVVCKIKIGK